MGTDGNVNVREGFAQSGCDFDCGLVVRINAEKDIESAVLKRSQIVTHHFSDDAGLFPARHKDGNSAFGGSGRIRVRFVLRRR